VSPDSRVATLQLDTSKGCGLAIGAYPHFSYDASGGGGTGELGPGPADSPRTVSFEPATLLIPPLNWRTTRVLGLPLPPGLEIAIAPEELAGSIDAANGAMQLRFRARFRFRLAGLYRAPDLLIDTVLSTGSAQGQRHRAQGQPIDADGTALLVGVASVPPCGDPWLDRLLGLPDEALAMLRCSFKQEP
jgi:hypothetical protein